MQLTIKFVLKEEKVDIRLEQTGLSKISLEKIQESINYIRRMKQYKRKSRKNFIQTAKEKEMFTTFNHNIIYSTFHKASYKKKVMLCCQILKLFISTTMFVSNSTLMNYGKWFGDHGKETRHMTVVYACSSFGGCFIL